MSRPPGASDKTPRKDSPLQPQDTPLHENEPGYSDWLAGRRAFAIQQLASGRSVRSVSAEIGVSESAVYKWLDHPDAQRELQHLLAKGRESARKALEGQVQDAADYVRQVITGTSTDKPDPVRLKACEMVFDRVGLPATKEIKANVKSSGLTDLTDEELEAIAEGRKPVPTTED